MLRCCSHIFFSLSLVRARWLSRVVIGGLRREEMVEQGGSSVGWCSGCLPPPPSLHHTPSIYTFQSPHAERNVTIGEVWEAHLRRYIRGHQMCDGFEPVDLPFVFFFGVEDLADSARDISQRRQRHQSETPVSSRRVPPSVTFSSSSFFF